MCPICNTKLTPIVYNAIEDPILRGMANIGQIILVEATRRNNTPRSYCSKCYKGYSQEVPLDNII
jgi:hypothetical protein